MKLCIIAILCVLLVTPALWAQTWTTTLVVDNTVPCPGGAGYFNPASAQYPAIEGEWVVFLDGGDDNCTANSGQSIWSYNLVTNQLVDLADTSTPVPEGTGDFLGFVPVCCTGNVYLRDGIVLFSGYDSGVGSDNCSGGLYTVPVGGGTIYRVVDYTMALPGYGGSFCFLNSDLNNGVLGASLDHGKIVFSAQARGSGLSANDGIWWAPANVNTKKSDLHRIADFDTVYESPFPAGCEQPDCWTVNSWSGADISGSTIAFASYSDSFGTGAAGLFVNKYTRPILLSDVILPGDGNTDPERPYDYSYFDNPVVDGSNIFFIAFDPWYQGTCAQGTFIGVFETTTKGSSPINIMNTCNAQPNGDALGANSFNQMAANEGTAVFQVTDSTAGQSVLDASVNGAVSVLIAPGDPLPSGASCDGGYHDPGCATAVSAPGVGGMNGGRVTFVAEGGAYWYDEGVYVASLPCASAASGVSVTLGALTYDAKTGIWTETATVKNTEKNAITGPLSLVLADLSSDVTMADGNGSTVCFAPPGSPYINLTLTDNELKGGKSVKAKLEFNGPPDAEISFSSEIAEAGAR
jgi:hypothetical protein